MGTSTALVAATYATLTAVLSAVLSDLLICIGLMFFSAALIAQPLMMASALGGIVALDAGLAGLRAHQARKMAAHAEQAFEHDGLPLEQQIAATAPAALIAPHGPFSTTLACQACGHEAALDAAHCSACGAELAPELAQPVSWRWVGGGAAAIAAIAVLLALLLGPALDAHRACSLEQPGAVSAASGSCRVVLCRHRRRAARPPSRQTQRSRGVLLAPSNLFCREDLAPATPRYRLDSSCA